MTVFAVNVDFTEHRESHAVSGATKRFDLFFAARLLAEELITGETEHREALVAPGLVDVLQLFILRRQAAFGGDVDDQQHVAAPWLECGGHAVNGNHVSVQNVIMHSNLIIMV